MRSRALVYFGSLLATIALINTPVPRIVVSAVLNPEAGDAVARSLASIAKDLVLVLLISIYFEWVRTREQTELLRGIDRKLDRMREEARTAAAPATRQLVLDATSPAELVTIALDRHLPGLPDKSSFVSMILSPRPAYHDVFLTLRVERVGDRQLHVVSKYELTMPRQPLLVAVTTSSTHGAALSAACPEIFEVITLPPSTPFTEAAKTFGERLECYLELPGQATRKVEFRRVPANAVRKHISPPVRISAADIALFVGDIGPEETEFVRLRNRFHWSQDLAEHFVYWVADRPMFISALTVDVRELVRHSERQVAVQVFLGDVESLLLDADEGHLSLRLDRWIAQGQGVVAVW